jgi:hypothetical protein
MDNGILKINWIENLPHGEGEFIRDEISVKINYVYGARQ